MLPALWSLQPIEGGRQLTGKQTNKQDVKYEKREGMIGRTYLESGDV